MKTMNNERDESMTTQPEGQEENQSAPVGEATGAGAAPESGLAEANEKLQTEKRELMDRLLRSQAELDNFRKRTQKEKEEIRQHGAENLIRSLLPTLDGFERALLHRDENVPEAFFQGFELIYRELRE